jgi:hypothetical protein
LWWSIEKRGGKPPLCDVRKVVSAAVAAAENVGRGDEEDEKTKHVFLLLCYFLII